jgi:probable F420-dependent oxidoreductase
MKLSLHLPMEIDQEKEFQNAKAIRSIAIAAEHAGFSAVNTTDHPAPSDKWRLNGGHDTFDPFAALAFMAAVTTNLRLHTHILVLPYRNPFITAKCAATVDVLSEGRLILGIGSGYLRSEYAAVGAPFETRGAAMDEALSVLRLAWASEPVTYAGAHFKAFGAMPRPIPVQKRLPIWGGGNSKRAIERAARLCDGYAPFFASRSLAGTARTEELETLEDFKSKVDYLKSCLEQNGRTEPFDILGGSPHGGIKNCNGTEAGQFVDEAGALARIGCTWMLATLPHPSLAAFIDNIQWAGEALVPKVGGTC